MKRALLFWLILYGISFTVHAQERTITGKVTSTEDNSPLPGVNVILKGTATGTYTDADGAYSLSIPKSGGILVFTFIGLQSKEIPIGDRSVVDIKLSLDVTQLTEVVVTALGLESDVAKLGSAVSQVKGPAAQQSGETGLIQGLSGKASGVMIQKTAGDPGAGAYIQIRGQSTITSSVQPLIVVDGVPTFNSTRGSSPGGVIQQSRMNDINPNDIESVEVLKGASAAALWGSRAANGVILITTKKGKASGGKPFTITYGATYSVDKISYKHDLQEKYGKGLNGEWSGSASGSYSGSWGDVIADRPGGPDEVDESGAFFEAEDGTLYYPVETKLDNKSYEQSNFDQVFQTGSFLEHNLSLSGGSDRGTMYASFSHLDQNGIMKESDYTRSTFRINATSNLSNEVSLTTNFSYAKITSNRIQQGSNTSGLYLGFLRTPADFDNRDYIGTYHAADGSLFFNRQRSYRNQLGASASPVYNNPAWTLHKQRNPNEVNRFLGNLELKVKPTNWLSMVARPGVDFYEDQRITFFPINSAENSGRGFSTERSFSERQLNLDMFALASFNLSSKITGSGLVGMNFNQRTYKNIEFDYQNFILDIDNSNASNATNEFTFPDDKEEIQRTSAGYTTLTLGYEEWLYLNASLRIEAASTFGSEAQNTFTYPSVDLAFNFSELGPFEASSVLSFGKIRAAYGEVGVQPDPYVTKDDYEIAEYFEGWGPAISAAAFSGAYARSDTKGNAKLEPERKKEIEVGLDLGFLSDRIVLGTTYYQNKTEGAIFDVGIAPSTGYSNTTGNAATLENKGLEIDLNATVLRKGSFSWEISANYNKNKNKVTSLSGTESLFLAGFTGTSSRAVQGEAVGTLWGGRFARDENDALILNEAGFPTVAATEGILGDPNPDWRGGLGTTVRFKGFKLYALFETFQGGDLWAGTHGALHTFGRALPTANETTVSATEAAELSVYGGGTVASTFDPNADGSYTFRGNIKDFGGGPVALTQTWYRDLGGGFGPVGEQFIVDGSWTRLRELTLSYTLASEGFRSATKLSAIDFVITGRNLAIWAPEEKRIGVDPETNLTGPSNGRGLEYFNNPGTRSYLFTVRLTY